MPECNRNSRRRAGAVGAGGRDADRSRKALSPGRRSVPGTLLRKPGLTGRMGAPAAQAALSNLPQELAAVAFRGARWTGPLLGVAKPMGQFLRAHQASWPAERETIYADYLALNIMDFGAKHSGIE